MDKELRKSIDSKIDELFATEAEPVEAPKSSEEVEKGYDYPAEKQGKQSPYMKNGSDAGPGMETADEGQKPKKGKKDQEYQADQGPDRGRPKDVQDVPDSDKDGSRAKGYDAVQKKQSKTPETSENGAMVKSEDKVEVSKEDFEILQKAKADSAKAIKDEELKKVEEKQSDLIKSAVAAATEVSRTENQELRKSLQETQELVKAIASKPQRRKSVDNIQAMEKSFGDEGQKPNSKEFSMDDMQDAAEELVKSKTPGFTLEHAIELDDSGSILDPTARKCLEKQLRKRN